MTSEIEEYSEFYAAYEEFIGEGFQPQEFLVEDHASQKRLESMEVAEVKQTDAGKPDGTGEKKHTVREKSKKPRVIFESPEIFRLIDEGGRTRPMNLLPDPKVCTEDMYGKNPMLKLYLRDAKTKEMFQFLQHLAVKNKIKCYKERDTDLEVEEIPKKKLHYEKILRESVKHLPIVQIQDSWIKSINDKLHNLHLKFPSLANELLSEIKEEFNFKMHEFGMEVVLKRLSGEVSHIHELPMVDEVGKTARYHVFLRRRELLKHRLHILHRYQRKMFELSVKILPDILTDFRKYRALGLIELSKLKSQVMSDIKKNEHTVTTSLYPKIAAIISRKRALNEIPVNVRPKFLSSATNILVVQVCD